ncbi:MAG: ATP-binding protein [Pseudomonadota bacterium]
MQSTAAKYDISQVKTQEGLTNPEVLGRIALAISAVVIMSFVLDVPTLFATGWAAVYILTLVLIAVVAAKLPPQVDMLQLSAVIALYLIEVAAFGAMGIWLWAQPGMLLPVGGLLFMVASMLHSVSFPGMAWRRRMINASIVALMMAMFVAVWIAQGEPLRDCATLAAGFALIFCYFAYALYQIAESERRLADQTQRRVEAERTAAVGAITGGVAHDFNNLLTAVMGNLELTRETASWAEQRELIDNAYREARRGADLTADLLSFSRKAVLSPVDVDVNDVITAYKGLIRDTLPSTIEIVLNLTSVELPKLTIDLAKFQTMLLNLVINARDAMPDGGVLEIRTERIEDKHCVEITVSDSGVGISNEILPRVTDPFFSTKPVGQGSGLGLSMVRGFVEQSGGVLTIRSDPGAGTRVAACLPYKVSPVDA